MDGSLQVPLSSLSALNGAVLTDGPMGMTLQTDPRQWAMSASAQFAVPASFADGVTVRIGLHVRAGTVGVGWLGSNESWVVRDSLSAGQDRSELSLHIPATDLDGRLILDNWTAGAAAEAEISSISLHQGAEAQVRAAQALEQAGETEQAIAAYRRALIQNPSHIDARAALGRLTFKEPDQPFLRAMQEFTDFRATEVMIQVRNPCNFRCTYCVAIGQNNVPVVRMDLSAIERTFQSLGDSTFMTSLDCGGGEPTVHPQFADLVRICANYGRVSFPTNNSQDPKRWLPHDRATYVYARSSLHPEAEEKMERYVRNARYLIDHGCVFTSTFVCRPDRLPKVEKYREYFAELGIPFQPVSFIGTYEGKRYPNAYTDEQKALIGLDDESRHWLHQAEPHMTRIRNFRGIPCVAGYRSIYVTPDGSLKRCVYDERVLDKPLDTPEPCGVKSCGCGMLLDRINSLDRIEMDKVTTRWRETAPTPEALQARKAWLRGRARELSYEDHEDALTVEHTRMYDALMKAYAKDEIPEP